MHPKCLCRSGCPCLNTRPCCQDPGARKNERGRGALCACVLLGSCVIVINAGDAVGWREMAAQQQALRQAAGIRSTPRLHQQQQQAPPQITQLQSLQRNLLFRSHRQSIAAQALVLCVNQPYFEPEQPLKPPGQPPISSDGQSSSSREPDRPLVRVRLCVHYRVHSRQMLCVGGSQIPFGWSFLSIAKVPMTWNQGDVWTCEVSRDWEGAHPGEEREGWHSPTDYRPLPPVRVSLQLLLPAGQRVEYKYVILEEQVSMARRASQLFFSLSCVGSRQTICCAAHALLLLGLDQDRKRGRRGPG